MAVVNGPWQIQWGGVALLGVEEIDPEITRELVEYDTIDGGTKYVNGKAKAAVSLLLLDTNVTELAKSLADLHVADAGVLADTTVVATTDTQGLIEIANQCAAAVTTADLAILDCTGEPYITIKAARAVFEAVEFDGQNAGKIRVKFVGTSLTTIATIGQQ